METLDSEHISDVAVNDLRIGMHIVLPTSWFKHPFLKNQFRLSSEKEIEKLSKCGVTSVQVDFSKSHFQSPDRKTDEINESRPPKKWKPQDIVPHELIQVMTSKSIAPEKKAAVVKKTSLVLMQRLLQDPSAQNIREAKKGIFKVVDCIISEDDTSHCLLNITNHDLYTYTHSVNVGFLSLLLAKKIFNGSQDHNIRELGAGFFLHDLGKVRVNSTIINKPGKLTENEMEIVRRHPIEGAKILADSKQLNEESKIIVMEHHERADGSGYPNGLKRDAIHLYARICSIADVYDALHSERPYKERLNPFDSLKVMRDQMMSHFQRDLFEKFVMLFV